MIENYYKNNFEFIKSNFEIFFRKIPYFKDENQTMNNFYEFVCAYNSLDKKLQTKNEYKDIFYKLFNNFWDIIAINNFINDIKNYYRVNNIQIFNFSNCNYSLKVEENEFNILLEDFKYKIKEKELI
jgi:hypothetical protein